jgi:hypothetical protein
MTQRRPEDEHVRAWFDARTPARAPEHLRHAVRAELAQTRQEGTYVPPGLRRFALAPGLVAGAALVVAVAVLAAGFLSQGSRVAGPPHSTQAPSILPSPTSSPSARPTPPGRSLPSGTAGTTRFTPGLQFTVPEGWVLREDEPRTMYLTPADAGSLVLQDGVAFDGINAYAQPVAGPADGGPTPESGVGGDARALATWLSSRPQLVATRPLEVRLAGRGAWQVDFGLSAEAGVLCGRPCVNLLNGPDDARSYQFGIIGPWRVRAFLLDLPDGSTLLVTVEDVDGTGLAEEVRRAQPILDSLELAP